MTRLVLFIFVCLLLSLPALSRADAPDDKTDENDGYASTYKQFLQFDADSIFAPSPFRLPDELGAASSEDRFHLNTMARFQYNTGNETIWHAPLSLHTVGELFYVNAEYSLLKGTDYDVRASYSFLQSIDNAKPIFDKQTHVGSLTAMYRTDLFTLPLYLFATYSYGYSFLNDPDMPIHPSFADHVVRPSIALIENLNNMTVLQYTFIKEEDDETLMVLGQKFDLKFHVHEGGIAHYFGSSDGKYYLYGGFSYDWQSKDWQTISDDKIVNVNFLEDISSRKYLAGLKADLPYKLITNVDYRFEQQWLRITPPYFKRATLNTHVVFARLSKEIMKDVVAFLEYDYNNYRNHLGFHRDISIYSVGLNYRF